MRGQGLGTKERLGPGVIPQEPRGFLSWAPGWGQGGLPCSPWRSQALYLGLGGGPGLGRGLTGLGPWG